MVKHSEHIRRHPFKIPKKRHSERHIKNTPQETTFPTINYHMTKQQEYYHFK